MRGSKIHLWCLKALGINCYFVPSCVFPDQGYRFISRVIVVAVVAEN